MTRKSRTLVLCGLLLAGVMSAPAEAPAADRTVVYQKPAKPKKIRSAATYRDCRFHDCYSYGADYGVFLPYETRIRRYSHYAEPFPHGFWWWW